MKLKLLTYNLLYGNALSSARKLISQEMPDVICVQELPTTHKHLHYLTTPSYQLATWTNSFIKFWKIFGIAIYLNRKTCTLLESHDDLLPESAYDVLEYIKHGVSMKRSFIEVKLLHKPSNKELYIYNTHLTHLSFVELRLSQIKTVFEHMDCQVPEKSPVVITGDFNLYNGKTELEKLMAQYNLTEATSNLAYTFQHPIFFWTWKTKLDYIISRNLDVTSTTRFDKGRSDHHPIITEFEIG